MGEKHPHKVQSESGVEMVDGELARFGAIWGDMPAVVQEVSGFEQQLVEIPPLSLVGDGVENVLLRSR